MKTVFNYLAQALIVGLWLGCAQSGTALAVDMSIVIDTTDAMPAYPTAQDIISELGLKDNPWQHIRIVITAISDKDVNDMVIVSLPAESSWTGNELMRKGKVQLFERQLGQCLGAIRHTGTRPYSIVYRAIARQANRLSASSAARHYLLVYSDLVENSPELTFYNTQTLKRLKISPGFIDRQLEANLPLEHHLGIDTWFIYNPGSYQQNSEYMTIASFYEHLFNAHGASTHIASKFQPL